MYKEHRPDIRLSPFIETYWSTVGFADKGKRLKVLPDGCVDIVFSFGDGFENDYPVAIVGTMTSALNLLYSGRVRMFGVRFRPVGITAFTKTPVEQFTNCSIDMALVETVLEKRFLEMLAQMQNVEDVISFADNYLITKLSHLYSLDRQILRAVDLIFLTKGKLSAANLASEVCLCQRHFERKFKSMVGINAKTLAKIVRFKYALQFLRNSPDNDLLSVAVNCGYYDHTHLIKDFKALSGETPAYFKL